MFDLGRTFLAAVERDPEALALVDGDMRLTYADWYRRISGACAALRELGLRRGDHLLTVLQNTHIAATSHWACQLMGVVIVPINWRATAAEIDFFIENSGAKAIIFDEACVDAVTASMAAAALPKIDPPAFEVAVLAHAESQGAQAGPGDPSLMLYTSGTTGRPKGVPRRHGSERAAAMAHVAQNMMPVGDRTLGVMPLYHTMGVRSLLAMAVLNGAFICLPRFDAAKALRLIADEQIASLYLVPTLYHDLLAHPDFVSADLRTARRLGYAGAPMTDGLLRRVVAAFEPELFVNHYGSSEIYTFTIDQRAADKPGSAGKAGLNQRIRVVRLGADGPDDLAAAGEEGEIIATLTGDEAFEGYWHRPDADAKALRDGWYFTGDSGYFDADGDLFVTGRVDDMIITGGENVSPVEVESAISMHSAVSECAVIGQADERWGQIVTAFVVRSGAVDAGELDDFCRTSGLANFKRPRRFIFVSELPKSPVGKLLRRILVAGDYTAEDE